MVAMKMRDRRTDRKVSGSRSSESVRRTDRQTDRQTAGRKGRGGGGAVPMVVAAVVTVRLEGSFSCWCR